jgi:hypothetical protein
LDDLINIQKYLGKSLSIFSTPEMPKDLPRSRDTSEEVLYPQGEKCQGMGFEFRKVDDDIRF